MKKNDILFVAAIVIVTVLTIYLLPLIPGYLRSAESNDIVGFQPIFITVFLVFNVIMIGIPAWIHRYYVNDYSRIKNIWFFALFGGTIGAILGEVLPTMNPGNFLMIIPYTILMLIYAQLYKRFAWWKVASTTYLGGILVENVMNRSPIQIPTLMWIGLFTYPYFFTKIYENREKLGLITMIKDIKGTLVSSVVLTAAVIYAFGGGPLGIFAAALPFLVTILHRHFTQRKPFDKRQEMIQSVKDLKWVFISSIVLIIFAVYISRDNVSPPLIILGAILPFMIVILYKLIKKR